MKVMCPRCLSALQASVCLVSCASAALSNRSIALAFRGHYLRDGGRIPHLGGCSNFFAEESNIRARIIRPLQDAGMRIHIVFHTFSRKETACGADDDALVARLRPTAHEFSRTPGRRVVDSEEEGEDYDEPDIPQLSRPTSPAPA